MALMDEENPSMLTLNSGEAAAEPPGVGFMQGMQNAYNQQYTSGYKESANYDFSDRADKQTRALRDVGETNIPHLAPSGTGPFHDPFTVEPFTPYEDTSKFYADGGDAADKQRVDSYDSRIDELKQKYPQLSLKNSGEMWNDVKTQAQQDERAASVRTNLAGKAGGFIGGAGAFINPALNPWGPVALIAGEGEGAAAAQIAKEAGAQGMANILDQLTGAQETRRKLGLSHGIGEAAESVESAAVGGAVAKGLHLGVVKGYNKYFGSTPGDIAPPPTDFQNLAQPAGGPPPPPTDLFATPPRPYHEGPPSMGWNDGTARGRVANAVDQAHVETQLQDWSGPTPHEVGPPMMTAPPRPLTDLNAPDLRSQIQAKQVDAAARQVDPDTFAKYDQLRQLKDDFRNTMEAARPTQGEAENMIPDIMNRMDQLKDKMTEANSRKSKIYQSELDGLEAERQAHVAEMTTRDTPQMASLRSLLMKADEQMRDLAPSIGRAYAQARGDWKLSASKWADVRWMVSKGDAAPALSDLGENPFKNEKLPAPPERPQAPTKNETMPILKDVPSIEGKLHPGADAVDQAKAVLEKHKTDLDEALETYRGMTANMLKDEENGKANIMGEDFDIDKDKVTVPNIDGDGERTISIRQLLQEQDDVGAQAKAIDKCSI